MRKFIAGSTLTSDGMFFKVWTLAENGDRVVVLGEAITADTNFPSDTDDVAKIAYVNKILADKSEPELTAEEITYLLKPVKNEMGDPV